MAWTSNFQMSSSGYNRACDDFAQDKIKPLALKIELPTGEYPQDLFDEFRKADLLGLCIPEEYGGSGAGIIRASLTMKGRQVFQRPLTPSVLLTRLPTGPIMMAEAGENKAAILARHRRGNHRAAFCRTSRAPARTSRACSRGPREGDGGRRVRVERDEVLDLGRDAGRLVRGLRQDR